MHTRAGILRPVFLKNCGAPQALMTINQSGGLVNEELTTRLTQLRKGLVEMRGYL